MKYLMLPFLFLASSIIMAQPDVQIVKIKNEDRSVSVYAVNNSNLEYIIKINIVLEGMKLEYPIDPNISVPAKSEIEVAHLIPTADKTNYKINFQAIAIDDERDSYDNQVYDITIYTKNGQEKSTELRMFLEKKKIPFLEINTSFDDNTKEAYDKMLERRGINKSEAKLPVVIIKGEAFYKIKVMEKFIKDHF